MVLSWKSGGLLLGIVFFAAVMLVKPIGVSTQFVILDGILWNAVDTSVVVKSETAKKGYASSNAYLNKSGGKYAKNVANPINYSFVFVLALVGGAAISALLRGGVGREESQMPAVWRRRFGNSAGNRYLVAFLSGVLVLFGARLAGGCTSGHMMSGMMQTAASGYIFSLGLFLTSIPLAMIFYKKEA